MSNLPTVIESEEIDSDFDRSNPKALINMVPQFVREQLLYLQDHYFAMSNSELEDRLFPLGGADTISSQLKIQFWDEYDRALRWNEVRMKVPNICAGIGSAIWMRRWCEDKLRLTWLIRVPQTYESSLADIHRLSITQMRKIMQLDACSGPQPNTRLMDIQFRIAQHVDQRVKGAVVQRVEQKTLSVHVNADKPSEAARPQMTMLEIQQRLDELRARSARLEAPAGVQVDMMATLTKPKVDEGIIVLNAEHKIPTSGY